MGDQLEGVCLWKYNLHFGSSCIFDSWMPWGEQISSKVPFLPWSQSVTDCSFWNCEPLLLYVVNVRSFIPTTESWVIQGGEQAEPLAQMLFLTASLCLFTSLFLFSIFKYCFFFLCTKDRVYICAFIAKFLTLSGLQSLQVYRILMAKKFKC